MSNDEEEIEKFNIAREEKAQISFDYTKLNESYGSRQIPLSEDYFISYSINELKSNESNKTENVIEQVITPKTYILNLILEQKIFDLEKQITAQQQCFDIEKANLLKTIEHFESKPSSSGKNPVSKSNSN